MNFAFEGVGGGMGQELDVGTAAEVDTQGADQRVEEVASHGVKRGTVVLEDKNFS